MRKEVDVRKLVRYQPLFQELNDAQIESLMPGIREIRIEKGRDLFHRDDPCDGLWLVVYGRVKLFITSPQGNEKVIEIVQTGQSFGEAVMFLRRPYPVSAHVLEDSMLLHVSESVISDAIETDKSFARHLLAGLSMRLHTFVQDVERYSMENPLQRVAGYLVQLSETPEAEAFTVSLPVNFAPEPGTRDLLARAQPAHHGRLHPGRRQGHHRQQPLGHAAVRTNLCQDQVLIPAGCPAGPGHPAHQPITTFPGSLHD